MKKFGSSGRTRCPNGGKLFHNALLINQCFSLSDSAGGLGGCEILKVHDAEPFLGVEVKFVDVTACQHFLESYSSGAVRQSLCQHACRLFALPQEFTVETQLKASTEILDLCLEDLQVCLQHIHLSQVHWMSLLDLKWSASSDIPRCLLA